MHLAAGEAQALERLRAGHFVDEVAVDIEEGGAVRLHVDDMVIPNLVVERARLSHRSSQLFLDLHKSVADRCYLMPIGVKRKSSSPANRVTDGA